MYPDIYLRVIRLLKNEAPHKDWGKLWPVACFSKLPKLFGPISGVTILNISSQRWGSESSNFAILKVFLAFKTC